MCTSPNYVGWSGKTTLKVIHNKVNLNESDLLTIPSDYIDSVSFGGVVPKFDFLGKQPYDKMKNIKSPWIQVPCGQCLECRIQQSKTWADRLVKESQYHSNNYFLTLTYSDDFLRSPSLIPDDFTKFIKRLRKKYPDLSYFMCGEYGDDSLRPHFHAIIFDLPLNDLTKDFCQFEVGSGPIKYKLNNGDDDYITGRLIHKLRFTADDLYYSPSIHQAWHYQGDITVGKVTFDSCQYVAGYVTKKYNKEHSAALNKLGLIPEYARMSHGIGLKFFQENDDWIMYDGHMIVGGNGKAHVSVLPRYYQKKFIEKYGENLFIPIRDERYYSRLNKISQRSFLHQDLDYTNRSKDYRLRKKQILRDKI